MRWLDELIGLATLVVDGIARIRRTTTEFVAGPGITIASQDDPTTERTIIRISAAGGPTTTSLTAAHLGGGIEIDVASSGAFELVWPAGEEQSARWHIPLPEGYTVAHDVRIELWVRSVADSDSDAATFEVGTSWGSAPEVIDLAIDEAPSMTTHVIEATIAAGDIPANAAYLTLRVTPMPHDVEIRLANVFLHL